MTQHMQSYSGQNYDKWVERNSNRTTLGKVQKQFWFTKSAVIRKLGKKEDEHVVASDAELDTKIEHFKAIDSSTKELQGLLAEYQTKLCVLAQEENTLGRLLKEYGKQDKNRAGKMMNAVGKSLSYTAQQRVAMRNPLVRLFQEVDTFHTRAVEDTLRTVTEMEEIRTEYRGALMWMKNISQDFNPDQYHQLEKFREVQVLVKNKKSNFDRIKIKSLQKTDLLAASRCNMFSHALILYQNNLITFCEKTAKTLNTVANNFKGYHSYDFQVIKELAEPKINNEETEDHDKDLLQCQGDKDDTTFFDAEYHDDKDEKQDTLNRGTKSNQDKSGSLVNLLDISESKRDCVPKSEQSSVSLDLLTNNPEVPDSEKDTQQMLKELFDSPIHQSLPVFGTDIPSNSEEISPLSTKTDNPFQLPSNDAKSNLGNVFLPSQLLDIKMNKWNQNNVKEMFNIANSVSSEPQMSSHTNMALPVLKENETKNPGDGKSDTEKKKLDWYKVFQDIDPLADPAGAIFGKLTEDKKC